MTYTAPSQQGQVLNLLTGINFIENFGYAVTIPLVPFLALELGVSRLGVGVIFAAYSLLQLVSSPLIGYFSDTLGRRPALLLSQLGTLLGYLCLLIANGFSGLLFSRIIDGSSGGNVPVVNTVITDKYPEKSRAKAFSRLSLAQGIGILLGPIVGSILLTRGLSFALWFSLALSGVILLISWRLLPETKPVGTHPVQFSDLRENLRAQTRNQPLRQTAFIKFFHTLLLNAFLLAVPILVQLFTGRGAQFTSGLVSWYFLVATGYQLILLPRTLHLPRPQLPGRIGFWLYGLGAGVLLLFPNITGLIFGGGLFMCGVCILTPLTNSWISAQTHESFRGSAFGLAQVLASLGQTLGPLVSYTLLEYASPAVFFVSLIAVVGVAQYRLTALSFG